MQVLKRHAFVIFKIILAEQNGIMMSLKGKWRRGSICEIKYLF